jgi:heme/copper-type cytochrome/quinol oxidase subunit 3
VSVAAAHDERELRTVGWWGMLLFVATEVALFSLLLASYFFVRFTASGPWPEGGIAVPSLGRPIAMTAILALAAVAVVVAGRKAGTRSGLALLGAALVAGVAFIGLQAWEYADSLDRFRPRDNAYASLFYTITSVHGVHLVLGVLLVAWVAGNVLARGPGRPSTIAILSIYWVFLAVAWVFVFAALYLSVRL